MDYTLNVGGHLLSLDRTKVMGILNVTPDSFYASSRSVTSDAVKSRVEDLLAEGADIIDIGACSTRPSASYATESEEMSRLRMGLDALRSVAPECVVSVDTFRADVARMCVEEYGVSIVNDISGGQADPQMFPTVARLGVPYVLTHTRGDSQTMQEQCDYDNLIEDLLLFFTRRVDELRSLGQKDIIIDPGFGFAKTLDQNYELVSHLNAFELLGLPILVGVSRKSMVHRLLGCTPDTSLNGTTALHAFCLSKGCVSILRVHDVKACREVISIYEKISEQS